MPTPRVVLVEKHAKNAEWRVVTLDQPRESGFGQFVVFSGALADALTKGEPLPEGTTEEPPKFDGALPSLRLPRKGGSGGGWRQSKEAFELEAAGRLRWQQYEQERMDRRTALMQSVAMHAGAQPMVSDASVERVAERFYDWLRESAGTVEAPQKAPGSTESDFQRRSGVGDREGASSPPVTAPAEPEGDGRTVPPGSHVAGKYGGYALDPDECTHKFASGRWLATKQVDGQPYCPRCGMAAVIYRESGA